MAEFKGEIEEKLNPKNILDEFSRIQDENNIRPILTPIYPQDYQGKQVIINADRLIFNARLQFSEQEAQGSAQTYEGGDIHMFSHNFISLNTNGSIHLNTLHPQGGELADENKNTKNYIMINAPNIFLGMDTSGTTEDAESLGRPKNYPSEPAVLGLENQKYQNKLLNLILDLVQKLQTAYIHIGDRGDTTSPVGSAFDTLVADWDGEGKPEPDSIGELRAMLKQIKSEHVFIKK